MPRSQINVRTDDSMDLQIEGLRRAWTPTMGKEWSDTQVIREALRQAYMRNCPAATRKKSRKKTTTALDIV